MTGASRASDHVELICAHLERGELSGLANDNIVEEVVKFNNQPKFRKKSQITFVLLKFRLVTCRPSSPPGPPRLSELKGKQRSTYDDREVHAAWARVPTSGPRKDRNQWSIHHVLIAVAVVKLHNTKLLEQVVYTI